MKQDKQTRYLEIDPHHPETDVIQTAAEVIRDGGTVAFPTETVYGLGANGLNPEAVRKIYRAKGRPPGNPLILHISSLDQARSLATSWPPEAEHLARKFLPGPLTLILPRASIVPDAVTAGLPGVALRYPAHPVALALITACGVPIAAPSANLSGHPSPTTPAHVRADLDGRIDLILAGGPTEVGVESTILNLCGKYPVLLRPGVVTKEDLEAVLQSQIHVSPGVPGGESASGRSPGAAEQWPATAPCPGILFKHYAPRAQVIMVTGEPDAQTVKIRGYLAAHPGVRVGVLGTTENAGVYREMEGDFICLEILGERSHPEEIANHLFGALRNCDRAGVDIILVETIPAAGVGLAVMNRLYLAADGRAI